MHTHCCKTSENASFFLGIIIYFRIFFVNSDRLNLLPFKIQVSNAQHVGQGCHGLMMGSSKIKYTTCDTCSNIVQKVV